MILIFVFLLTINVASIVYSMPTLKQFYLRIKLLLVNSEARVPALLNEYADTEFDSAWQNLEAIRKVSDSKLRASFFQHAMEEVCHASLFRRQSRRLSKTILPKSTSPRVPLFRSDLDEQEAIRQFIAYECVGESDADEKFEIYSKYLSDQEVKDCFARILQDEVGHKNAVNGAFRSIEPSSLKRFFMTAKIRLSRMNQSFFLLLQSLFSNFAILSLGVIYFLLGPFLKSSAKKRIGRKSDQ